MARHNFLIQRSVKTTTEPEGLHPGWLDCGQLGRCFTDEFGNRGYADIKTARADLKDIRRRCGDQHNYRLIQIIS